MDSFPCEKDISVLECAYFLQHDKRAKLLTHSSNAEGGLDEGGRSWWHSVGRVVDNCCNIQGILPSRELLVSCDLSEWCALGWANWEA